MCADYLLYLLGWVSRISQERTYYFNPSTNETQWEFPESPAKQRVEKGSKFLKRKADEASITTASNQEQKLIDCPARFNATLYCFNCAQRGHDLSGCSRDISFASYGTIVYQRDQHDRLPRILLIERRDSHTFVQFLKGFYDDGTSIKDEHSELSIAALLKSMRRDEQNRIRDVYVGTTTFHSLYTSIYQSKFHYRREEEMHGKFKSPGTQQMLRSLFSSETFGTLPVIQRGELIDFPRGKIEHGESERDAAVREFCEECGYVKEEVDLLPVPPISYSYEQENFRGSGRACTFTRTFFLGRCQERRAVISDQNQHEVSALLCCTEEESGMHLADDSNSNRVTSRARVLAQAFKHFWADRGVPK